MLSGFFTEHPEVAIAFSGGVDSAYLAYEAVRYAKNVRAYYVKSVFQPEFELEDAMRLSKEYQIPLTVIEVDVLSDETVRSNPCDRCYYCKRVIFESIMDHAAKDGFTLLLDGTNASDVEGDRPGMRALRELQVVSPLRECGLTKDMIRSESKKAGLFTWNKPAYACLATRIASGEIINSQRLLEIDRSETFLRELGFNDFRVRCSKDTAKLQVKKDQLSLVIENREQILGYLKQYFKTVLLDLEVR